MSLILDALKKSEAERQRGQTPNLMSPVPTRPSPAIAHKKSSLPWILLTVFLSATSIAGFFYYMKYRGIESSEPASLPATAPMKTATKTETQALPAIVATPPPAVAAIVPAAAPATPAGQTSDAKPFSPFAEQSGTSSAPAEPAVVEPIPEIRMAGIADMPVDQRQQLPALKLSMHVYSVEAGKRFAIIDGQRVNEGSTVGEAVVEEIRQDGVVLSVQGQSYLLPRP